MTARAVEGERQRRARLANMRQELLAPVSALVGYIEMLIEFPMDSWRDPTP